MCHARWYLAQLKPNSARVAERNLRQQGFRTFLPYQEVTRRGRGRFTPVQQPVFPGYIFVEFDADSTGWSAIRSTVGVRRLVCFGADPAPVPPEIVKALMARCDPSGKLMPPDAFAPGDRVVLTQGPFADTVAKIESAAPDHRVWVLLSVMGSTRRVAVPANAVRTA